MHPAVRILVLLAVASALPAMSLPALGLLGSMLLLVYLPHGAEARARLRSGLLRLRWLILAIVVLYGGFTPGEPLFADAPGLSREGLSEGLRRTLVLVDLLVMVYLLLAATATGQLVAALQRLLWPLRSLGVDPRRTGLRIALALDGVGEMHAHLKGAIQTAGGWDRAAALIEDIERRAHEPAAAVVLAEDRAPRPWEWLLPVALAVILHLWTP